MPKTITAAERAARRAAGQPATPRTVAWRKKGCTTCKPIVRPLVKLAPARDKP